MQPGHSRYAVSQTHGTFADPQQESDFGNQFHQPLYYDLRADQQAFGAPNGELSCCDCSLNPDEAKDFTPSTWP